MARIRCGPDVVSAESCVASARALRGITESSVRHQREPGVAKCCTPYGPTLWEGESVDIDVFGAVHAGSWQRLEELTQRRRLSGAEADELVRLYQLVSAQLSQVRSTAPDPALTSRLSQLLASARSTIAGAHEPAWRDAARFVFVAVPAALYRLRWWVVAVTAGFLLVAVATGLWAAAHPEVLASLGTQNELKEYAEEAFEAYYSNYPAPAFAAQVWTNNAWIALQCVGLGITGIWPVMELVENAVAVGQAGAVMGTHGYLAEFFGLIAPHGLLELTAIFVAGAAGLRLFWTVVDPGPRPRGEALAAEGRAMVGVGIGLVGVLLVSGIIEGFVPRMAIPGVAKALIGVIALAAFWAYVLVLGRRAVAAGETGDVAEEHRSDEVPVAA